MLAGEPAETHQVTAWGHRLQGKGVRLYRRRGRAARMGGILFGRYEENNRLDETPAKSEGTHRHDETMVALIAVAELRDESYR
jgi:hypothetical protein